MSSIVQPRVSLDAVQYLASVPKISLVVVLLENVVSVQQALIYKALILSPLLAMLMGLAKNSVF